VAPQHAPEVVVRRQIAEHGLGDEDPGEWFDFWTAAMQLASHQN
jgi:hypothetical protein